MRQNTTIGHQWTFLVINAQMYTLMSKKGHWWTKIYNSRHTWTSWKEERGWGCPELGVFLGIWGVFEIQIKFCKFRKTKRFPSSKTCKLMTILSRWYVYTFFTSYTSKTYQNCMFPAWFFDCGVVCHIGFCYCFLHDARGKKYHVRK